MNLILINVFTLSYNPDGMLQETKMPIVTIMYLFTNKIKSIITTFIITRMGFSFLIPKFMGPTQNPFPFLYIFSK